MMKILQFHNRYFVKILERMASLSIQVSHVYSEGNQVDNRLAGMGRGENNSAETEFTDCWSGTEAISIW